MFPGSLSSTLRKFCRKGSALNPGQQERFLSLPSYHRWLRKTCESLYGLLLLVRTVRVVRVVRGSCFSSRVFVVIFTAKDFIVCFSVFVSFALFAVHVFYLDCSLSFSPQKILWSVSPCSYCSRCSRFMILKRRVCCLSNREMRENREQKGSVPCSPEAVRGRVQGEGFPSPPGWEPKAVKEEEALVRVVRVVRGS